MIRGCACVLLVTLAAVINSAQEQSETTRLRTRVVLVDALVKDKLTGAPIEGLGRDDFRVLADRKERQISYFSFSRDGTNAKRPLAIVLVLQLWPAGAGRFLRQPEIPRSLGASLYKLPADAEVSVIATFVRGVGGNQRQVVGFTRDRKKVADALASVPDLVGDHTLSPMETITSVISQVTSRSIEDRPDSKVVIVNVSDGFDPTNSSERAVSIANLLEANAMFSCLVCDAKKTVQAGIIALAPLAAIGQINPRGSEHLAVETGGDIIRVHTPDDYALGLQQIVNGLKARYTLGFELDDKDLDDNRVHPLEVQVQHHEGKEAKTTAVVLARRGYYLPKASAKQ